MRYIDIGAFDGIIGSKTHSLEILGCEGVCVEASPLTFERLVVNRRCKCINALCTENIGQKVFRYYPERPMKSHIVGGSELDKEYIDYEINTVTINSIMEMMKWDYVDFLKVDAEGHDAITLNAVDYSRYQFGSIMYEKGSRSDGDPAYLTLEKTLMEHGYQKTGTFGRRGQDILWQKIV